MVRTQYMTLFTQCGVDTAKAVIATERGLGKQFQSAVTKLLEEKRKCDKAEVVAAYELAVDAMEEAANKLLVEEYGEGAVLSKYLPAWRQYKSKYKALLKKLGGEALTLDSLTINAVNKWLAAESKKNQPDDGDANKGPASTDGGDSTGKTDTTSDGGGKKANHKALAPEVQKHLDNLTVALSKLDEAEALSIVQKSESIAWGALKRAGNKVAKFAKAS